MPDKESQELIQLDPYTGIALDDRPIQIEFSREPNFTKYNEVSKTQTNIADSARRHVVAIKDILTFQNSYAKQSSIKTKELISEKEEVNSIGFFIDEYIPDHFPNRKDCLIYYFTINGRDYEVVPLNSIHAGKKIIKSIGEEYWENDNYSIYLDEKIESAILNIVINCPTDNETPYVKNIKILKK